MDDIILKLFFAYLEFHLAFSFLVHFFYLFLHYIGVEVSNIDIMYAIWNLLFFYSMAVYERFLDLIARFNKLHSRLSMNNDLTSVFFALHMASCHLSPFIFSTQVDIVLSTGHTRRLLTLREFSTYSLRRRQHNVAILCTSWIIILSVQI